LFTVSFLFKLLADIKTGKSCETSRELQKCLVRRFQKLLEISSELKEVLEPLGNNLRETLEGARIQFSLPRRSEALPMFPEEYPLSPPGIRMMTESGRFVVNTDI